MVADVGATQADAAPDREPVAESEVAAGGQPFGGQPGQVAAGQPQGRRPCLGKDHRLGEPTGPQQQRADHFRGLEVELADDAGAGQPQRPRPARPLRDGEQLGQQRSRYGALGVPAGAVGRVVGGDVPGAPVDQPPGQYRLAQLIFHAGAGGLRKCHLPLPRATRLIGPAFGP